MSNATSGDTIDVSGTIGDNVIIPGSIQLTITQWPGQPTAVVDGDNAGTVFTINSGGTVILDQLTIQDGYGFGNAPNGGVWVAGGVYICSACNVTVNDSTITDNTSGNGAGIFNDGGVMTVTDSTISDNTTTNGLGSGIYNNATSSSISNSTISGNTGGSFGGGIYNVAGSALTVTNSTISGNTATSYGAGIYNTQTSSVTITNSTISDNSAAFWGGGIFNASWTPEDTVTITNSTISDNSASSGGGIYNQGSLTMTASTVADQEDGGGIINTGTALVGATIVAQNTGGNCDGTLSSQGYNLTDDTTGTDCGFTQSSDITDLIANLGPLADNGGPTETQLPELLPVVSAAIGQIPSGTTINGVAVCSGGTDQRGSGFARPASTGQPNCTIGAVNVVAATPITQCSDDSQLQSDVASGGSYTFECPEGEGAIQLSQQLVVTSNLVLDSMAALGQEGEGIEGPPGNGRVFDVTGGVVALNSIDISGGRAYNAGTSPGGVAASGAGGDTGAEGGTSENGSPGGNGGGGAGGLPGGDNDLASQGGGIFISSGATVSLNYDTLGNDDAFSYGGNGQGGGNGGNGGNGGSGGPGPGGTPGGHGGVGGDGGTGGNGGNGGDDTGGSQGGAVYVSSGATLEVANVDFDGDWADSVGGAGGDGGNGGQAGECGAGTFPCLGPGVNGRCGAGGLGGKSANAQGGAIYNAGTLDIADSTFGASATSFGGNGGSGERSCPNSVNGSVLGAGGDGGSAGGASGGAIYSTTALSAVCGLTFDSNVDSVGGTGGSGSPAGSNGVSVTPGGADIDVHGTSITSVPACTGLPPVVSSVTPTTVQLGGSSGSTVTVYGANFGAAGSSDTVKFCPTSGANNCTVGTNVSVTSPNLLTLTAPTNSSIVPADANSLLVDTVVSTTAGSSLLTPADQITFDKQGLQVTSVITPDDGDVLSGLTETGVQTAGFQKDGICVSGCADITVRVSNEVTKQPVEGASVAVSAIGFGQAGTIQQAPEEPLCAPVLPAGPLGHCGDNLTNLTTNESGEVQLTAWLPGVISDDAPQILITASDGTSWIRGQETETLDVEPNLLSLPNHGTFQLSASDASTLTVLTDLTTYSLGTQISNICNIGIAYGLVPVSSATCKELVGAALKIPGAAVASKIAAFANALESAVFLDDLGVPPSYQEGLLPSALYFTALVSPGVGKLVKANWPSDVADFLRSFEQSTGFPFIPAFMSISVDMYEVSCEVKTFPIPEGSFALYVVFQANDYNGVETYSNGYLVQGGYDPGIWLGAYGVSP